MADQQDEVSALLNDSGESTVEQAMARAREIVDRFDNVVLNIAVLGESGTGKSSLVNALRSISDTAEGAAPVGETETTKEPKKYSHPTLSKLNIWDLPGMAHGNMNVNTYVKKNKDVYDLFIIVGGQRITRNESGLAKKLKVEKKKYYFVRSKVDIDVENAVKRGVTEEDTLQSIRETYEGSLAQLGCPPIFLITSHDLSRFDFPKLVNTLEEDLPESKRDALVMGLPVYSKECLEKKYKTCKKAIWGLAAVSAGVGGAPVPGLSTAVDIAMVGSFFTACYHSFGLDDKSLIKLGERVNKPILDRVKESELIKALASKTLLSPSMISKLVLAGAIETACAFIPIAGNVVAAAISFITTRSVLREGLKELYNVAREVIEMAELN